MPTFTTAWRRVPAPGSSWLHSHRWGGGGGWGWGWCHGSNMRASLSVLDSPAPPLQERDRLQELVDHQTQEIEQVGGETRRCRTGPGGV